MEQGMCRSGSVDNFLSWCQMSATGHGAGHKQDGGTSEDMLASESFNNLSCSCPPLRQPSLFLLLIISALPPSPQWIATLSSTVLLSEPDFSPASSVSAPSG